MTELLWGAVDSYITDHLVENDPDLEAALHHSEAAGLPAINVSVPQGKLLHLLARLQSAAHVLEVGTLGGYSAIWLGRAVAPGGSVVTVEVDPTHAEVARANLARAGLEGVVDVRVGAGLDVLPVLAAEPRPPFDMVFIDADKPSNPEYFAWALRLTRPGSLIVVDNVVRSGEVVDAASSDPGVIGTRRLFDMMAAEPRVSATAIQTVGSKGYDGLAVALVLPEPADR